MIPQFGLGRVCNPHNPADVEEKLLATLNDAATFRATPSIERFVAFHSTTNFAAHWTSRLRARLNVPQSDDLLSWDWTTAGERMAA